MRFEVPWELTGSLMPHSDLTKDNLCQPSLSLGLSHLRLPQHSSSRLYVVVAPASYLTTRTPL